jgi:opine dehydrogenase
VVTTRIEELIAAADVLIVAVPATAHRDIAAACAPHLTERHTVVLSPGRTGGALEFALAAGHPNGRPPYALAEMTTTLYVARSTSPWGVRVHALKRAVRLAALPAHRTPAVLADLADAYPGLLPAASVLETSLLNVGCILHPLPTLLNAARIEAGGTLFAFYHEGISPSVAKVCAALDAERMAVARAYGVPTIALEDWLHQTYGSLGRELYERLRNTEAYASVLAPAALGHRYLEEDVATGLVPLALLARKVKVPTPHMDATVTLAGALRQVDFWTSGRTLDRLGVAEMDAAALRAFVL